MFESLPLVALYVAVGIAVLRYRIYDIDRLISRTLVYGVLTAGVVALYVGLVGVLSVLFQARASLPVALVATAVVAVVFQPLRERAQRAVNRLLYGERDNPLAVISRLAGTLEAAIPTEAVLPTVVTTAAQALEHDRLGAVTQVELGQDVADVGLGLRAKASMSERSPRVRAARCPG